MGIAEGIVAITYENEYAEHSRLYQFFKYHLWTGSSAYVTCPSAMTDGAARLLYRHINAQASPKTETEVFKAAYSHLTSRDPEKAWTSGQWMTERVGGSDVRSIETLAACSPNQGHSEANQADTSVDGKALGPWVFDGFK